MRSSSIWVPLVIAGAAAVTVVVLVQRQPRLASKADERRLSGPASVGPATENAAPREPPTASSFAERLTAGAPAPPRPFTSRAELDADLDMHPSTPSRTDRGEAYDAVSADDLGAEWLARATEAAPVDASPSPKGKFDELTTLDLLDDEPSSLPTLELEPDSKLESEVVESEALLGVRGPADLEAQSERPRVPAAVFDIAEITQEEDAPPLGRRRS